jgi:hypothetical protein
MGDLLDLPLRRRRPDRAAGLRATVTGGIPTAHYAGAYRDFDGIRIATARRAYRRNPDGTANKSGIAVAIDIADIRLF